MNRYLKDVSSTKIAAVAFSVWMLPALVILIFTGFFSLSFTDTETIKATSAGLVLGIVGTALASIIFYTLLKRAGIVFSSLVTYGIPFVALMWGLVAGEDITMIQLVGLAIILCAVYITNKK